MIRMCGGPTSNGSSVLITEKTPNASGKASKTRPLMNLNSAGGGGEFSETLEGDDKEGNLDSMAIGSWKVKDSKKRGSTATKRVRSNWVPRIDEGSGVGGGAEGDEKYSGGEDNDDGYRDFDMENSESPLKEQSPIQSLENLAIDGHGTDREMHYHGNRRSIRTRVSEGRDHHDGVELSCPSDTDGRDWKCGTSGDRNGNGGRGRCGEDAVRIWLNGLGLSRYGPVFEIHEVDDEVLPMLTLEDLKDMGINAVGSRRKMYCAIQKLGKGFS
ncbi:Protein bicaudal C-1-like protein [Quillaja saponaria]|uniref:Protein bicaudal C-1-like protein n=1 Tax=Quillaja saponaria TaxID=32244 RepID=A0AAD7PIU8_QUISA|nr:Protein bicaudal C-1-like protein [Quillaja saponaria]